MQRYQHTYPVIWDETLGYFVVKIEGKPSLTLHVSGDLVTFSPNEVSDYVFQVPINNVAFEVLEGDTSYMIAKVTRGYGRLVIITLPKNAEQLAHKPYEIVYYTFHEDEGNVTVTLWTVPNKTAIFKYGITEVAVTPDDYIYTEVTPVAK